MQVRLTEPLTRHHASLHAGMYADLPEDEARKLIKEGRAERLAPTGRQVKAPANRMMRPNANR